MEDLPANYAILQDCDGKWALWATEAREFIIHGAQAKGIVTFFEDTFGPEAADHARTEISYALGLSEEERAARWREVVGSSPG